MDDILPNMEDLIQQRLADIHIQIQALKQEQKTIGNNKDLFNIYQQKIQQLGKKKGQVFEYITNLFYDLVETYKNL